MAWTVSDRFPSWGEAGESPADGFFYEGGDQVNEKHLDYLWNSIRGLEDDVQAALNDIDSDADGVVDTANAGAAPFTLGGDLVAIDGETLWNESAGYIPQPRLENDSITLNGGDGLKGGSTAALGGSFSLDIEPTDFAGDGVKDDGADNIAVEPTDFAGDGVKDDGADNIAVEPTDFAGENLADDGSDNLKVLDDPTLAALTFDDADADGSQWEITEDATNGHLNFNTDGGATNADLEHDGTLRIAGELTENASL